MRNYADGIHWLKKANKSILQILHINLLLQFMKSRAIIIFVLLGVEDFVI